MLHIDLDVGQNEVAGLRLNFSTMLHCCRKCLVSLDDLRTCDTYEDIHADYHESRTDEMLFENYQESLEKNVLHINGVWTQSLFKDFPYFNTCLQLPQCSSHDLLEGCAKIWIKLILEHFVKSKWMTWDILERLIASFPYKGKDAGCRPPFKAKKMKNKASRRIVGTFSEMANLIRSLTQLLYDHLANSEDYYWQLLLGIRKLLKFIAMPKLSAHQIDQMDAVIQKTVNLRMKLTKIENVVEDIYDVQSDAKEENESISSCSSEDEEKEPCNEKKGKVVSKYSPPIVMKEHFLSHLSQDIRNLAPLCLTNTDLFESKVVYIRLAKYPLLQFRKNLKKDNKIL